MVYVAMVHVAMVHVAMVYATCCACCYVYGTVIRIAEVENVFHKHLAIRYKCSTTHLLLFAIRYKFNKLSLLFAIMYRSRPPQCSLLFLHDISTNNSLYLVTQQQKDFRNSTMFETL